MNQGKATVTVTGKASKGYSGNIKALYTIGRLNLATEESAGNITVTMPAGIKYRFAESSLPKSKKVADYYLSKKKGGADKAQIQMHFTSFFFRGIIMRIQKIRRRMYAPQKLIPLSKIHADEKTSAMQDYDTRFYPSFQEL